MGRNKSLEVFQDVKGITNDRDGYWQEIDKGFLMAGQKGIMQK